MKPTTLTSWRLWLPVLAAGMIVGLASWDQKQVPQGNAGKTPTDTLPKKKKAVEDRKVRDLDDVIEELESVEIEKEMKKAQEEISKAMKEIDGEKIRMDIEKTMKEVDFSKMKADIEKAMKSIDLEKMKVDLNETIAKIDWEKMRKELEEIQKVDFSKIELEMKEAQEEMKKIQPMLEKELANVKVEMEKAKVEIEKAKVEMKEYKGFVDGLEKDGLINKKEEYTIKHEDGVLTINGKKASDQVYNKYKTFLEKHKKFNIEKTADDFDIDMD